VSGVRALRVLFVANDGLSAGHVARAIAIARALPRRAAARGLETRAVLATTSQAHSLLAGSARSFVVAQLPAPAVAQRAGFSDAERRRLVRGALEGVAEAFAPDVVVIDTFPEGPHGEAKGLGAGGVKRVLVRRSVPVDARDAALVSGLRDHDLAIVADDPSAVDARLPIPVVRVPPITIAEARDMASRAEARAELGVDLGARAILVAAGGGGDEAAAQRARSIAASIARVAKDVVVAVATGPLARREKTEGGVVLVDAAPLQPWLAAFDGAFAPAGYNTAHELAKAGVPSALFAQPRPFDDQAARAARFAEAGLARAIDRSDDRAIAAALDWMQNASKPSVEAGGADRAADAVLDLATGGARR
jgi:predicted glycosyltransferase